MLILAVGFGYYSGMRFMVVPFGSAQIVDVQVLLFPVGGVSGCFSLFRQKRAR